MRPSHGREPLKHGPTTDGVLVPISIDGEDGGASIKPLPGWKRRTGKEGRHAQSRGELLCKKPSHKAAENIANNYPTDTAIGLGFCKAMRRPRPKALEARAGMAADAIRWQSSNTRAPEQWSLHRRGGCGRGP